MDSSDIASLSTALSAARTGDAVGILVLKKAIAAQSQNALQLLESLPAPASNPPHLGQNIDVKA